MSKAEDNSHPTSDADKPPPDKGDAEKNNPAQHEFARTQLKKATEMATAFVSRLQPPPGNPKAMIYDLVCHTLGGLIWTLQQTKSDMQRGYCKLSDRKEFVEIEQAHFDTIIHQHHPEYRGEPLPLTQSRADILIKEIAWRVNELLGPLNKIKSDDARNDLLAEIDRFTKKKIARYTVEPFGEKEVVKEMAALQQLILRWIDRWQLPISPQNIAYHVHWAFKDYGETIRDFEGPLPPTADAMRPAEGIHYLESLIRRLEELGEQEYFAPDGNSDGDSETSRNDNKSDTRATRVGESAPGIDAMSAGPGWHFMRPPSNRQGRYEPADYYFNDADAKIIQEWIPDFDADQAKFSDLQTLLRTEFGMPFDESLALNVRQIIDCLSRRGKRARIGGSADYNEPRSESPESKKATHNADFTMVNWFGEEYTFALGVQSSAVKALWDEWEKSGLGLHQDTIRNSIDAERDNFRMDKVFRNHPAFGTMIHNVGDGRYKLASSATSEAAPKALKSAGIPRKSRRKPR